MRGLRTFCVAARHLSFKAAAEELCITPSAVSHQIKGLEESFNTSLFRRLTRGVALTEAGMTLYSQVDPHLVELDEITMRFLAHVRQRRVLRITLMPFFASEIFIPRLAGFTDRHGVIDIRVETTEAGASHSASSDASILLLASPPVGVCAIPLFPLQLVPACSPELAGSIDLRDPASMVETSLIVHKSRPTAWNEWFALAGIELEKSPSVIYLDSMFSVARAAERGLGVALVPLPLSASWFASGVLTRVFDRELVTSDCYYFVYRAEDAGNADVRAFRDWVVEAFVEDEKISATG
jgi:LysR family transcriptional regulator, glycine cleavage system transcriptional activator